ncbi:MAG: LysM peptidoglycan-binding domain-containing protein, partial [Bdellovibrionota bacterium]
MNRRFFFSMSSPFSMGCCVAAIAIVVLSLSQVRAQDLDEAIDQELDSATDLDQAADLESEPDMPKTTGGDDLEDIDLEEDEPVQQAAKPAATPVPAATGEIEDELELDEPEDVQATEAPPPQPIVEEPAPKEPTIDEPTVEQPVVDEPTIDEPEAPTSIAREPPPSSDLFDPPNTAFEKRLHSIVGGVRATDDASWDEVLGERRTEIYPVQVGDTLWDISQTFFGDGFFWGKLWSQNGTIENPHEITKGQALKFVAGTEGEPPAIGVAKMKDLKPIGGGIFKVTLNEKPTYREDIEGEITLEEVESGIALETSEIIPAPTLPPPSKRIPLLKELPRSFKFESRDIVDEGFDASGIKGAPAIRANEAAVIIVSSFAADREPESLGKVDEIEAQ